MLQTYLDIMRKCGCHANAFEKALLELDELGRTSPDLWYEYNGEFREAIEMVRTIKEKRK